MHGFGPLPIDADQALFHEAWEARVSRMLGVVLAHTTIDRFRYTIERMPPDEYLTSSYYERWLWALEHLAREQGLLDSDDRPPYTSWPSPTTPTWAGRFEAGDQVRVRNTVTSGHTRVPR